MSLGRRSSECHKPARQNGESLCELARDNTGNRRRIQYRGTGVTHEVNRVHPYPGMLVPAVIEALLDHHAPDATSLLDPFCGTGRTLVAGRNRGMSVTGIDLNPLAVLIARLRVDPPQRDVDDVIENVVTTAKRTRAEAVLGRLATIDFPFKFWFSPKAIRELAKVLNSIELNTAPRSKSRTFALVCFSETVRICSYTRPQEHKLYRKTLTNRRLTDKEALGVFLRVAQKNARHLRQFMIDREPTWKHGAAQVLIGDSTALDDSFLKNTRFDVLITSPPYGDARTTVAYGEFARLSLMWTLAMEQPPMRLVPSEIRTIDRKCLGGTVSTTRFSLGKPADRVLRTVEARDVARSRQVFQFLADLRKSLSCSCRLVRPGGVVSFVVGRRNVAGIRIPLDTIIASWADELGVSLSVAWRRAIPYKRLPRIVARRGVKTRHRVITMLEEHVLIGTKE